jgi:hypothetical protein
MGKYGVDPTRVAHFVGVASYIDLLSDSTVKTVDMYGSNATVLTGELARVDGAPVIPTEHVREDLNASGVHDGVTSDRSVAITARDDAVIRGQRRALRVEILRERYADFDQDAVKVTQRQAFEPRYGTDRAVAVTYNVNPT